MRTIPYQGYYIMFLTADHGFEKNTQLPRPQGVARARGSRISGRSERSGRHLEWPGVKRGIWYNNIQIYYKTIVILLYHIPYYGDIILLLSKEVGKQYFRVTNDFYLVQLTMMKGGRSCNNT
jgi:hypothetical protein